MKLLKTVEVAKMLNVTRCWVWKHRDLFEVITLDTNQNAERTIYRITEESVLKYPEGNRAGKTSHIS